MNLQDIPRYRLAQLPTPIEPLPRLTEELGGPELLVKRDDQTGLALGGNKTRKLEFLLPDALAQEADTLVTAGGAQSNHCRQTAAAAAKLGLGCELCLGGTPSDVPNGNVLLDLFCGAKLHWTTPQQRNEKMAQIADELRSAGRRPYVIPIGGSNGLGSLGYVHAMFELVDQLAGENMQVDQIVVASSSGGTQAGLVLGARLTGFQGEILGISIDQLPSHDFEQELAQVATQAAEIIKERAPIRSEDFVLNYDFLGGGYGVIGDLERDAIKLAARLDALIIDPVYTARAMGGLIDLIQRGYFSQDQTVLFWHTGGVPALFARADELF